MPAEVPVLLDSRSYSVWVGRGLLASIGDLLGHLLTDCAKVVIITDEIVAGHYAQPVLESLQKAGVRAHLLTVPAGEKSKSFTAAESLCEQMSALGLDRHLLLLALGGGVVGDLAGLVAAIYLRGIPFVQIPTTVLAQVDSSVGGKTGINLAGGKNLVGVFHQPRLVLADLDTLETLPAREFNSGFAEIIKHALIRDPSLFEQLKTFRRAADLEPIIRRNIEIKAAIVSADEHELTGQRALLNFGHTIGHGIEAAAGYGPLLHGEAISLGIVAASRISVRRAGLSPVALAEIISLLKQFSLPVRLPEFISTQAVLTTLQRDKKFVHGSIRFVLLREIGAAFLSSDVSMDDLSIEIEALR